ncbi:MAG: valine--tRNA ligase [Tepidisphaeraceae bacterium]|jgi:valyl-tRNA synthetase
MLDIANSYDPAGIEGEVYRIWMEERCFSADPAAPGEPYSIVIPPPNVTGALHLGHAINTTLQDILTRVHRMRGFNTVWIPGIDHAGIATQAVVEKQLKEKENKTRHDVGREALVERIWQWKQQYGDRIIDQLKRLGCSCDWDRTRFTLDDMCARAVRETFFKLFKDGLIYRGKRLVNWDVHLQTSISDDEIYHETVKTSLWHIRYPIEGTDKFMTVATTRPETMLGDTAVAVHSQDPRWNWAIGKSVALPLTNRRIPIIADDILVDPKFGTGVVKVTPAHDPNDYAVWQRHKGADDQIEIINILNPDGTLNQNAGDYAKMKREAARKKVVEDLTGLGLLEKEEPYETQVGHSDRSKTPIEPYLSDQWFVKMAPLAEPALQVVRDGTIKFFPERHAQQYLSWLGEKRDWPISRQLWWGHRIPVWTLSFEGNCERLTQGDLAKFNSYIKEIGLEDDVVVRIASGEPPRLEICTRSTRADRAMEAMNRYFHRTGTPQVDPDDFKDVIRTEKAWELARNIMDGSAADTVNQDPDVLDTWFSSALWPHSTLGWPDDTPDLRKWYPTSVLLTGRDIVTLWVARMVMMGIYNMEKIPFAHVAINPTILDGHGERMSKSKGNGVDPVDVIETHGADALRFTLTHMATETQDVRMPVKRDAQGRNTSDKFDLGSRFCNKIWQVALNFVIPHLGKIAPVAPDAGKWTLADRWIVSRFNRAVKESDEALRIYRFDQYAKICYDFFYNDFCDWYVESAKFFLKDSKTAGQTAAVLAQILDGSLRLMHPMIPFITEVIWERLNSIRPTRDFKPGHRLIRAAWPKYDPSHLEQNAASDFSFIQQVSTDIRNVKNEYKADPKLNIDVYVSASSEDATVPPGSGSIIGSLTSSTISVQQFGFTPPSDSIRSSIPGFNIYYPGLYDGEAEKNRLSKRREELVKLIQTLKGRLSNESYVAKAPPHLVKQTQDQLAEAEAELAQIDAELAKLKG